MTKTTRELRVENLDHRLNNFLIVYGPGVYSYQEDEDAENFEVVRDLFDNAGWTLILDVENRRIIIA